MPTTSGIFTTGLNSDIDTSAERLKDAHIPCVFGVLVVAHKDNAGIVYVGPIGVTAESADATDGMPLAANERIFIEIDNLNKVYVIASVANQKAFYLAI